MDNDCDHVWVHFPWFSMCVNCFAESDGEDDWEDDDDFPEDIVIGPAAVIAGGEPIE